LSGEKKDDDKDVRTNIGQNRRVSSEPDNSETQDKADTDVDNEIAIANHKDTLQSFIQRSTLGVQFAIIVLFYLARGSLSDTSSKSIPAGESNEYTTNLSPFSFTSRQFFDAYSQLASEMGLTKYLLRHMAFAEFMLTLEYLALVREDELTSNFRFGVDFDDLRWLASVALQQIAGGYNLSSPEIFYPSAYWRTLASETPQPDKTTNTPTMTNTKRTADLIKDLSLSIFSREETELNPSGGTSKSYDDFVRPRSKDYGLHWPYPHHRAPPTIYNFRKPDEGEWKRIIKEFFEGQKCIACNAQVLPQQFDVWIGEPLEDNATPSSKRNQRMSEVLADAESRGGGDDDNNNSNYTVVTSVDEQQIVDPDKNLTDRELLTYNYGIIPMDGREAFIAFAKPKLPCANCGANPADSVSLMPKY
jgi:hypothetical protein